MIGPLIVFFHRLVYRPIPDVSLSLEPANITAVANNIGTEIIFLRLLIAQARPEEIAVGTPTSGGSPDIIMALKEARKHNILTVARSFGAACGFPSGSALRLIRVSRKYRLPFTTSSASW